MSETPMEDTLQEREEGLPAKIEKLDLPPTPPSTDDDVSDHFEEAGS